MSHLRCPAVLGPGARAYTVPGGCADAWTLVWSVQVRDPRDSSAHFFNGVATIGFKTDYALRAGIGGVMIWEAGQDCRQHLVAHDDRPQERHVVTCPDGDGRWSLLNAIQRRIDAHYGGGNVGSGVSGEL